MGNAWISTAVVTQFPSCLGQNHLIWTLTNSGASAGSGPTAKRSTTPSAASLCCPPMAALTLLSQILASVIAVSPQEVVVFWQNAMHLIEPQEFRRMVQEGHLLPLIWLWVSIHAETTNTEGVMHVYTTGLHRLGLTELEIPGWEKDEQAAFRLLSNIAMYLVGNGKEIADGETLSTADQSEVITAEYGQDSKHPDRRVVRLRVSATQ